MSTNEVGSNSADIHIVDGEDFESYDVKLQRTDAEPSIFTIYEKNWHQIFDQASAEYTIRVRLKNKTGPGDWSEKASVILGEKKIFFQ